MICVRNWNSYMINIGLAIIPSWALAIGPTSAMDLH